MRSPNACAVIWIMALCALVGCSSNPETRVQERRGAGISSEDAVFVGTPVSTIVELSDMYVSPETYDLKLTVAEIVRGQAALDLLKKLGSPSAQTGPDSECILARVRFEYKARGAPGDKPWDLKGSQFSAFSGDRKPYEAPSIPALPTGRMPVLRSGDALECWLSFIVAKSDRNPVMLFNPGTTWFRLY